MAYRRLSGDVIEAYKYLNDISSSMLPFAGSTLTPFITDKRTSFEDLEKTLPVKTPSKLFLDFVLLISGTDS